MRSKNSRPIDAAESAHLALVKSCACSITDAPPPSEAHHIRQGDHYTTIALSKEAHTGPHGIHGDKTLWKLAKLDELGALNITLARVDHLRSTGNAASPVARRTPQPRTQRKSYTKPLKRVANPRVA